MTPEQDALDETLRRCRKIVAGIEGDRIDYAPFFPLSEDFDAEEPSGIARHLVRSFAKSFEQLQDQVARQLCRSVLIVVRGPAAGGHRKIDALIAEAAGVIGLDAAALRDLTDIRNSLAHEYAMRFSDAAPILNRAWRAMPVLIAMVATIDTYVHDADLLKDAT